MSPMHHHYEMPCRERDIPSPVIEAEVERHGTETPSHGSETETEGHEREIPPRGRGLRCRGREMSPHGREMPRRIIEIETVRRERELPCHEREMFPHGREIPRRIIEIEEHHRRGLPCHGRDMSPHGREMPRRIIEIETVRHRRRLPCHGSEMDPHGREMPPHGIEIETECHEREIPCLGREMPPHGREMPCPGLGMPHHGEEVLMPRDEVARMEAVRDIARLYDAGGILFTKELIWDVYQQLRNSERGDVIWVTGMKGELEHFVNGVGRRMKSLERGGDPDTECVLKAPTIQYRTFQDLIHPDSRLSGPSAYAALRIMHPVVRRNKITKEIKDNSAPIPSLGKMEDYFQGVRKEWERTQEFEVLKEILKFKVVPTRIQNVIGFGLGRMAVPNDKDAEKDRSTLQHALILSIRDILEKKRETPDDIDCFAQDFDYTSTDKIVLRDSGVETLDDPEGILKVDGSSVVVSCEPNIPVKQIICEISRPAIIICKRIKSMASRDPDEALGKMLDPDSPRVKEMVCNEYHEFKFPTSNMHFGDLAIYIRREEMPRIL